MATNFKDISEKVFNLLKGHGFDLKTFDKNGKIVIDPQEGTRFISDEPNILVRIDDMEKESSTSSKSEESELSISPIKKCGFDEPSLVKSVGRSSFSSSASSSSVTSIKLRKMTKKLNKK